MGRPSQRVTPLCPCVRGPLLQRPSAVPAVGQGVRTVPMEDVARRPRRRRDSCCYDPGEFLRFRHRSRLPVTARAATRYPPVEGGATAKVHLVQA